MAYKKEYSKAGKKYTTDKKPTYKPKRGPLSKLMSEEEKQKAGIHELSYDFGCRITRLFQYLTEDSEYKEYVISKQIYRSGTSVGANVRESKHAQSDADFLSKMSIAYKEALETAYWLRLLNASKFITEKQFNSIYSDCSELIRILGSTQFTMRKKLQKGN